MCGGMRVSLRQTERKKLQYIDSVIWTDRSTKTDEERDTHTGEGREKQTDRQTDRQTETVRERERGRRGWRGERQTGRQIYK